MCNYFLINLLRNYKYLVLKIKNKKFIAISNLYHKNLTHNKIL